MFINNRMPEIVLSQDLHVCSNTGPLPSEHCCQSSNADRIFREIYHFDGFSLSTELFKFVTDVGVSALLLAWQLCKEPEIKKYFDDRKKANAKTFNAAIH
jgi:hypothetical protein